MFYCSFNGEPKSDIVLRITLTGIIGYESTVDNDFGWGLFYFIIFFITKAVILNHLRIHFRIVLFFFYLNGTDISSIIFWGVQFNVSVVGVI